MVWIRPQMKFFCNLGTFGVNSYILAIVAWNFKADSKTVVEASFHRPKGTSRHVSSCTQLFKKLVICFRKSENRGTSMFILIEEQHHSFVGCQISVLITVQLFLHCLEFVVTCDDHDSTLAHSFYVLYISIHSDTKIVK